MNGEADLITVFRSADDDAHEEAEAVRELLSGERLEPVLLDDSAPGVPEGAYEVRVPPQQSARAEELIGEAHLPDDELTNVNETSEMDMETVFSAPAGTTAEMESMSIKSILEGAGIAAMIIGDQVLPNLPFEVRVARDHAEQARKLIEEARAGGPAAAEQGATESGAEVAPAE